MSKKKLKLGAILSGVGIGQNEWRHPELPGDAARLARHSVAADRGDQK
ncbi:hypothetical protein IAI18_07640 [Acetobacteraceae bacterium H6797]|nr:hypothetical protein [Acetobacteraceae bacterium H6797]